MQKDCQLQNTFIAQAEFLNLSNRKIINLSGFFSMGYRIHTLTFVLHNYYLKMCFQVVIKRQALITVCDC
jgi:hypothetical protein